MELSILRYESRAVVADRRHNHLIGGISRKWGRELAAFDQDSNRKLGYVKTLDADREVQPLTQWAIQN